MAVRLPRAGRGRPGGWTSCSATWRGWGGRRRGWNPAKPTESWCLALPAPLGAKVFRIERFGGVCTDGEDALKQTCVIRFKPSGNRLRPTARRIRVGAVAGVEGQCLGKQPEERAALLWFGGHCQGCAEGLGGGLRWMVGQALAVSGQESVQVGHGAS